MSVYSLIRDQLTIVRDKAHLMGASAQSAEARRSAIVGRTSVGEDAVQAKRFDPAATQAVGELASGMNIGTLADTHSRCEQIAGHADNGIRILADYLPHEDHLNNAGVDGSTVNPDR